MNFLFRNIACCDSPAGTSKLPLPPSHTHTPSRLHTHPPSPFPSPPRSDHTQSSSMARRTIPVTPDYHRLSNFFESHFSSEDVELIAKKVIQKCEERDRYHSACKNYRKYYRLRYNFHPETGCWLGSTNRIIERVKQAVRAEYRKLSTIFKNTFTAEDVKSIAHDVIRLGNQKDRYRLACEKYHKPNCLQKFNFHPVTHVWLGSSNENRAIGRVKKAVSNIKKELERQNDKQSIQEKENQLIMARKSGESARRQYNSLRLQNEVCQQTLKKNKSRSNSTNRQLNKLRDKCNDTTKVIVSTYLHLCDDTHTLTLTHTTLGAQTLCRGNQSHDDQNKYLEQEKFVSRKNH